MQVERGATAARLAQSAAVAAPPPPARFTFEEWQLSNNLRSRNADDQQQLAERVLKECERVRQETRERAEQTRATTERRLQEWVGDVEFNKAELDHQRAEICRELEALGVYRTRLQDCLHALLGSLDVCRKCILLREGRLGIDLVVDDVEKALQCELNTITGGQNILKRALEQTVEQMRRLRATRYTLDRDLLGKQASIDIDRGSLNLRPSDSCLSIYEGYANLDPANITADEYNAYSAKNIELAGQEVAGSRLMRVYVDTVLKQVVDDLSEAYTKCNHAYNQRITDTKRAKARLEDIHSETAAKVIAMEKNILELRKALADKEAETALAHTRLGRRAQREAVELVHDPPAQALLYECETLRHSSELLQQMLHEATASLRYLLQVQIQLEEDINVKMNTLKIDEVDCMTSRDTMHYHYY